MEYDLVVVGGGPAGYVGAIRAAQLGKKVVCVESDRAGGTCLNWGCIPTKALLKSAEFYQHIKHSEQFGIKVEKVSFDFAKVIGRSRGVADQMAKGIEFLFKSKKVDYIRGSAKLQKDKSILVTEPDGKTQTLKTKNVLLATGAKPRPIPGLEFDGKRVLSSKEAMNVQEVPESIVIIGAGAIGVEFAYFFNAFGSKVTLVEMMPKILPVEDAESSDLVAKSFVKQGIEVLTETKFEAADFSGKKIKLSFGGKGAQTIEATHVLVAVGIQANTAGLFGDGVTVNQDRGYLKTDDRYQTNIPGVYAAGDIIGPPWLAHVASYEAIQAVEGIFNPKQKPKKVDIFPGCTYCQPQVASIGLTEAKAKEKGLKYKVSKFPYKASGKAVASGDSDGFVKLITGEKYGEIIGAHIVGQEATELIAEVGLAMNLEATVDEISHTIHAHPTLSEMIMEASHVAQGHAIHI